jgi:CHAD domain-containing protein
MTYHLLHNEPVDVGIKRMAGEQVDRAIGEIDDDSLDRHETVHQVRKRCKKVRAVLRLVRLQMGKSYDEENAWYRDAARELSDIRDAQSLVECYDKLMQHYEDQVDTQHFTVARRTLTKRRGGFERIDERLAAFRDEMLKGRDRIASWPLEENGVDTLVAGLGKTYRRARRSMRAAYRKPTADNFHEWRKRAKYHWYHARVIRDIWSPVMRSHRDEVDRLGTYLGDDHDLAILREAIHSNADEFGDERDVQTLTELIDRRRKELESKARSLGERIFAEKTGRFLDRMRAYWDAWIGVDQT